MKPLSEAALKYAKEITAQGKLSWSDEMIEITILATEASELAAIEPVSPETRAAVFNHKLSVLEFHLNEFITDLKELTNQKETQ